VRRILTPEERIDAVILVGGRKVRTIGEVVRRWEGARWRLGMRVGGIGLRERGVEERGWKAGAAGRAGLVGRGDGGVSRVENGRGSQDNIREMSRKVEGTEVNGSERESVQAGKKSEEGRKSTEVEPKLEGLTSKNPILHNVSDATRHMQEEKAARVYRLIREEVENGRLWMVRNNYDYENASDWERLNWHMARRREVIRQEEEQREEEEKTISPEKKEAWLLEKKTQQREKVHIQKHILIWLKWSRKHPNLSPWEDKDAVDALLERMKLGSMADQGIRNAATQHPSAEEKDSSEVLPSDSSVDSPPSNDFAAPASEPHPRSRVEHDNSDSGKIESDRIATRQGAITPSTPPMTENTYGSTETSSKTPTISPPDSADLDRLGEMLSELIKQNRIKPNDLALAAAKQKEKQETPPAARIKYVASETRSKSETDRLLALKKKSEDLIAMMKEMGIDVSPEEVAILAADARMVKRIEREEREERAKYWSWRSVPISGRQDVGREVREEKEKGDEKEVEKESSSSLPRETPPRQGKDSSSVVVVGKATDQVIEVETESSEKSLDDLEKEMRDADAEIFKAARFLAGRYVLPLLTSLTHTHPPLFPQLLDYSNFPPTSSHPQKCI